LSKSEQILKANRNAPVEDNTCTVFITYHPDSEFCNRVKSMQQQIPKTIIVDNHSTDNEITLLKELTDKNTILLTNKSNMGIAAALNQAAAEARRQGFTWILTFDQDSICEPDLMQTLSSIYQQAEDSAQIALIGSNYISSGTGRAVYRFKPDAPSYVEVPMCITSASLTSLNAIERVGGFKEKYFIDAVDTEICFRFRAEGLKVLMSTKPLITHSIGNQTIRHIFGISVCTADHSPLRRYYMTRNRILLAKKYIFKEFRSVTYDLFNLIEQIIMLVLFEQDKWNKLKAYATGLYDGLINRTGKK